MKRVIVYATSLCLTGLLFAGSLYAGEPSKGGSKLPTEVEDFLVPELGDGIERSLIPTAEAWLDYALENIEIVFNKPVGNVTVTITDAQGAVVTVLRASSEAPILLPLPGAGSYKMTIAGEKYLGESKFVID